MSKLKIGDQRYYIPGYRGSHLLAILVTIRKVDKRFEDGYYWIDEPIGHSVEANSLMYQDEAVTELLDCYEDEKNTEGRDIPCNAQLADFRRENIAYIKSNYGPDTSLPDFTFIKDKEPWKEWFNPQMIFDKRQGHIRAAAVRCPEGKVYWTEAPGRHNHAMAVAQADNPTLIPFEGEQGFILQDETFVDRRTAAKLALEHGQVVTLRWGDLLYSEDLW